MKLIAVLGLSGLLAGGLLANHGPAAQQQGDEVADEPEAVSESSLELYINVYKEMQADHALTLDRALASRSLNLERFRALERRVQKNSRYVERVRKALLEQARRLEKGPHVPPQARTPSAPKP